MRVIAKFGTMMIARALFATGPVHAQETQIPPQEQHHQMNIPVVKPEYPRMGRTQENAKGSLITLEEVQTTLNRPVVLVDSIKELRDVLLLQTRHDA